MELGQVSTTWPGWICDKDLFNHEICVWWNACTELRCAEAQTLLSSQKQLSHEAAQTLTLNDSKVVSQVTQNRFYFAWEFKNKLYIINQITFKLISFQLPKNNFTFFIKNWSPSVMKYMLDVENTGNKRKVSHLLCFNSEIILLT